MNGYIILLILSLVAIWFSGFFGGMWYSERKKS